MRSGPARAVSALEAFRQRLRDATYVDGQSLAVESVRRGRGRAVWRAHERDGQAQARLIAVAATGMAQVARQVTTRIPVVFMFADQPLAMGRFASLVRPGSNLTGRG